MGDSIFYAGWQEFDPLNFYLRPLKKKIRIVDFLAAPLKKNLNPLAVKPAILRAVRIKNGTSPT